MTACPASAYLYNHKQKYCGTVTPTTHLLDISQLPVQALSSRGLTKRAVSQEKKKKGSETVSRMQVEKNSEREKDTHLTMKIASQKAEYPFR